MSWLRLVMPRTWRRVQCQHLGAKVAAGVRRPLYGRTYCSACRTWLGTLHPETIHTLAGKRRR